MQRTVHGVDIFKWPERADKLNTLKEDLLFVCSDPMPAACSSSSRSITYSLPKSENDKANMLLNKAYYHTKSVSVSKLRVMVLLTKSLPVFIVFRLLCCMIGMGEVIVILVWCDNKSNIF
jgi:hypothetical protein